MKVSSMADLHNHSEAHSLPALALSLIVRLGEGMDAGVAGDSSHWDECKIDAVGSLCWSEGRRDAVGILCNDNRPDNVCELDESCRYTGLSDQFGRYHVVMLNHREG